MSNPPDNSGQLDRLVGRSAFGIDAAGYHMARSGYSGELFEHLAMIAAPGPRILEIGAGTGLATEGLLRCSPSLLTLVEPDPRLCEVLADRFSGQGADVICGTFPETIPQGKYDLIACAAAFHWMEPALALAGVPMTNMPGMGPADVADLGPIFATSGLHPTQDLAVAVASLVIAWPRLPRPSSCCPLPSLVVRGVWPR